MPTDDSRLALIADLLARAEGGTTQAERDLALARAQREAARHGIDLAEAAYHQAQRGMPVTPEERTVVIGVKGTAGLKTLCEFFVRICQVNDVHCLVARTGETVYAHGMSSDIDTAEMLYASLLVQMNVACEEWLATGEYRRRAARPHRGVARRNFADGFVVRIIQLLYDAKTQARDEAEAASRAASGAADPGAVTTTALALRAKSEAVEAFHHGIIRERRIRGSWSGDRRGRHVDVGARRAGRSAADRADLGRRGARGLPGR